MADESSAQWQAGGRNVGSVNSEVSRALDMQCPECKGKTERRPSIVAKPVICRLCMGSGIWHPESLAEHEFVYNSDFDTNGLIYYIGSNSSTKEWTNPAVDGGMVCTRGSMGVGNMDLSTDKQGVASDLLSREGVDSWTMDYDESWWQVDLGNGRAIRPSHYTLRHGSCVGLNCIRHWRLEGSVNGKPQSWVEVQSHLADVRLNEGYSTNTWKITHLNPDSLPFRFFRIVQTNKNSSNSGILALSGLELYGSFLEYKIAQA